MNGKRIASAVIAAVLTFTLIPKIDGNNTVLAATEDKDQFNTSLGVSSIGNPTSGGNPDSDWIGSYVYFGTFNDTPIKFRVLQKDSTVFTDSEALFLDSDAVLLNKCFYRNNGEDSNQWRMSEIYSWLNWTFFSDNNFTAIEMSAVPNTKSGAGYNSSKYGPYERLYYGEKVFLLDAADASNSDYGYSQTDGLCVSRMKSGTSGYWWLRTHADSPSHYIFYVCVVGDDGTIGNTFAPKEYGVAPALNIDQESIVFTTEVENEADTFKLTLTDNNLRIAVPDDKLITAEGATVTVPYEIAGADAENATRASVLILDDDKDEIIFYDDLNKNSGSFGTSSSGTFDIPAGYDLDGWGSEYFVYILAEDINGEKKTDYASAFIQLDEPIRINTISVNVTTYDTDGKTKINETGGTASLSATTAVKGDKITVMATAESGYTLKNITWGNGNSSTDISSAKEFTVEEFDVTVEVAFQKDEVVSSTSPSDSSLTPVANTYTVIQGADGTWDGKSDYVIEVKSSTDDEHCIDRFKWAAVDGIELKHGENMDLAIGSTIVIIKSDYLKTLDTGKHNVVVNFTDNSVATTLTISAASTTSSGASVPATGEMQSPAMYVGIVMIIASCGAVSIFVMRKLREES